MDDNWMERAKFAAAWDLVRLDRLSGERAAGERMREAIDCAYGCCLVEYDTPTHEKEQIAREIMQIATVLRREKEQKDKSAETP